MRRAAHGFPKRRQSTPIWRGTKTQLRSPRVPRSFGRTVFKSSRLRARTWSMSRACTICAWSFSTFPAHGREHVTIIGRPDEWLGKLLNKRQWKRYPFGRSIYRSLSIQRDYRNLRFMWLGVALKKNTIIARHSRRLSDCCLRKSYGVHGIPRLKRALYVLASETCRRAFLSPCGESIVRGTQIQREIKLKM